MAKQITLHSTVIQEIRYRPHDSEPNITIYYDVLDEQGNVVGSSTEHQKLSAIPSKTRTSIDTSLSNISEMVNDTKLK